MTMLDHGSCARIGFAVAFVLLAVLFGGRAAAAQELSAPPPRIAAAETVFAEGLEAFEAGDYGLAFRRFQAVIDQYPFNRKTTAAWLMAGKALYRNGAYERAAALLERFVEKYPESRYVPEAERIRRYALEALAESRRGLINLGIALPLDPEDAARTQALFNGIRLAVEEHNRSAGDAPLVRMVFRNTHNAPRQAAKQVRALADEGVDVILGPLYSEEAVVAAAAAERARVTLVTPLATDEAVSAGRRFVFQANPTITRRGQLMARFAVNGLRLRDFGIIAELNDSVGERMAEGFHDEALRLGATVQYYELLPETRDWYYLPDVIGVDSLTSVDALYLPIPPDDVALADGVLSGLESAGVTTRVLGGKTWHDLPITARAGLFRLTYSNDFFVDHSRREVQSFEHRYRTLTGASPGRLAFTGYDLTRFLIRERLAHPGDAFTEALREAPRYEGLGMRIHFNGNNVNEALFYHRYRDGKLELLR